MKRTTKLLIRAGFTIFVDRDTLLDTKSTYATKPAEPNFPFHKRHPLDYFVPSKRDVFVSGMTSGVNKTGKREHFCYVTSHVRGTVHRHKPVRGWYDTSDGECANIFASGKNVTEAVTNFIKALATLDYNNGSTGGEIGMIEGA